MDKFFQNKIGKVGRQHRIDAHEPQSFVREYITFYRVLFGHQNNLGFSSGKIAWPILVVIGEWLCRGQLKAETRNMREKSLRVAGACQRVEPQSVKCGECDINVNIALRFQIDE